ncbi:hypothetical protein MANES_07G055042v8 [Manihot esculenta]|uniref:Uncharacterized protein n=1 Tax=Manihot esculenta TaxID=3983 RepID=A0ACB7HD42_MANES|nr:hypothetical protein MANES_07G055042v8 [Manihot esculenta]
MNKDKNKEEEAPKISLRSKINMTNTAYVDLFSGQSPRPNIFSSSSRQSPRPSHRPIYTNTTSIMNRPLNPMSSALIIRPSSPQPKTPSPQFTLLNKFTPLQPQELITPSTFKQAVIGQSSSPNPLPTKPLPTQIEYSYKPIEDIILTIEPEYWTQNPNLNVYQICNTIFPKTHYYIPDNFSKNQSFYESILIKTNSIIMHNNFDPHVTNKIRYCKVRIIKVLTISDWGQEPHKNKDISLSNGQLTKFNYYDYQLAWERTFLKQNDQLSISFFFYISDDFSYPIPYWFHQWWNKFGIDQSIILEQIQLAQNQFFENAKLPDSILISPKWLIYSHLFHIPWIHMSEYQIKDQTLDNFPIPNLIRKYKIKWWSKTDLDNCNPKAVEQFLSSQPQYCKTLSPIQITKQETFLAKKQQIMAQMAKCVSEEEYDKLLEELKETRSSTVSPSPVDLADDNDDFFTQEM